MNSQKQSGFTLIETLIYLGLFAIVIGGGMVAAYEIIQSTDAGNNHIILQEEANFLLRKINWSLTGATALSNTATSLTVTKNGTPITFDYSSPDLKLGGVKLNSSSISVSPLSFQKTSTGNGIIATFTLTTVQNGRSASEIFSTTKYLRQ